MLYCYKHRRCKAKRRRVQWDQPAEGPVWTQCTRLATGPTYIFLPWSRDMGVHQKLTQILRRYCSKVLKNNSLVFCARAKRMFSTTWACSKLFPIYGPDHSLSKWRAFQKDIGEKLFGTFCKALWSKGKIFTCRHKKWILQKPSYTYHVMANLNKVEHLVGSLKVVG